MNNIFGGTFGARLNMNLREEKHWTYGAASLLFGARAQRPFLAYSSVQTDKTADTIREILGELKGMLGERPVTLEELDKVKRQQTLELPGSHETMSAVGNLLGDLLQFGLPIDFYDHYVSEVAALTVADIDRTAKTLLDPAHIIWLVVGDRAAIETGLQELGIGEVIPANA
jgi:zinc protease